MKVLVTGATGLVGKKLCTSLVLNGHEIIVLSRDEKSAREKLNLPGQYYSWQPTEELAPKEAIENCDAIINLMGENLSSKRWSDNQKQKIISSRIDGTNNLAKAINQFRDRNLKVFISTSAVGIYKVNLPSPVDENGEQDNNFLSNVCYEWEKASHIATKVDRIVNPRIGVVIDANEGMMSKVLPLFRLGLGGPIGFGSQKMSWIHVDDLVSIYIEALENDRIEGALNAVSPQIVSNKDFSKALSKSVGIPNLFPAPTLMLKLVFGEMSSLMLDSVQVIPQKLLDLNFEFEYETIEKALDAVCDGEILETQFIEKENIDIVRFFQDPSNLSKITPKEMNFSIIDQAPQKVEEGIELSYKFKKYGLPLKWVSKIKNLKEQSFTDIQLKGPYKKWVHEHHFLPVNNGSLIIDRVRYQMPLGPLGSIVMPLVHKDIKKVFEFRKKALNDIFK